MNKNYYPTYFITGASVVNDTLVLSVNGSPAISEHIHFALRFAPRVAIPSGLSLDTPVKLAISGTNYQLLDKYAEQVVFGDLPKDGLNDNYFSPRFVIVGGIGSSDDAYYYIGWDIPVR